MNYSRIVFWQENPSPHQAAWIRALAGLIAVTGVFSGELTRSRLDMGWQQPDYGDAQVFICPDRTTVERLVQTDPERSVHIFSSMFHNARLNAAIRNALSTKALIGILSEGRDWRNIVGWLRRGHSLFNEQDYRKRVNFVLAIGHLAARWYRMSGYEENQIFPFCYVVDSIESSSRSHCDSSKVTLCFVGQLIKRKRVDLLIHALSKVRSRDWQLKVIGDGKERHALEKFVKRRSLDGLVRFAGVLDNRAARLELAGADIFVLPSRWDGWGAVVNEAMMSGVPAICSSYCGAADLIRPGFNGELFQSGSVDSLATALDNWISRGPLTEFRKEAIREWSRYINGESIAHYFLDIVEYLEGSNRLCPEAPWVAGMPVVPFSPEA